MNRGNPQAALVQELHDVAADELVGVVLDHYVARIRCAACSCNSGPRAQLPHQPLAFGYRQMVRELDIGDLQIADVAEHGTLALVVDNAMVPEICGGGIAEDAYSPLAAER